MLTVRANHNDGEKERKYLGAEMHHAA